MTAEDKVRPPEMPTSAAISCMPFLVPRSSSAARFILTHVKEARLWEVLNSYLYIIEMDVVKTVSCLTVTPAASVYALLI